MTKVKKGDVLSYGVSLILPGAGTPVVDDPRWSTIPISSLKKTNGPSLGLRRFKDRRQRPTSSPICNDRLALDADRVVVGVDVADAVAARDAEVRVPLAATVEV